MYPHGYGGPYNVYPPEDPNQHRNNMMPPEYASSRFHHDPPDYNTSSFHYPPAQRPPFPPYNNPCPDAPPPAYPPPFPAFYPPQSTEGSFYPPAPPHTAPYPPPYGLPHVSSFEEHNNPSSEHAHACPHVSSFGEHIHSSAEHAYARPTLEFAHHTPFPHHSSSFPHHTSSFQENKPWISEQVSITRREPSPSASAVPPPVDVELPKGKVVRVFCKSSRSYNLAVIGDRLMMVEADSGNESQQWIREDKYSIRVRDSYGHPAFMLINKASKKVLKHAKGKYQEVQLINYSPGVQDDDLFWTESQDFGEGFKTVRMASDTLLNLSAGHGNRVEDGSSVILDTWHKKDNQLWKIFPL